MLVLYTWGSHNLLTEADDENPTLSGEQVARNLLIEPPRRPRLVFQDLQPQQAPIALEWSNPRQHFIEDHPQAVDVAAGVHGVRFAAGDHKVFRRFLLQH